MRMKNKVKDFEAEFKEWWEVATEYFTKELEKNMVQHKTNEFFFEVQVGSLLKEFSKFHLWQSNKYRGIKPG
jgi:hypothetical protein